MRRLIVLLLVAVGLSAPLSVSASIAAPATPTNFRGAVDGSTVSLTWEQPPDPPMLATGEYHLHRFGAEGREMSRRLPADARSFVDADVPAGVHTYRLIAFNSPAAFQQHVGMSGYAHTTVTVEATDSGTDPVATQRLVFTRDTNNTNPDLWIVDANDPSGATPIAAANSDAWDYTAAVSPDGATLAFVSDRDGDDEIYTLDLADLEAQPVQQTKNSVRDASPTWSPDSKKLAYVSEVKAKGRRAMRIFIDSLDGEARELVPGGKENQLAPAWSPDGNAIAASTDGDLFIYPIASGDPVQLTDSRDIDEWQANWSPDGSRIVFTQMERHRNGSPLNRRLAIINADGTGLQLLDTGEVVEAEQPDFQPSGDYIAFSGAASDGGNRDLYRLDISGLSASASPTLLLGGDGYDTQPEWASS